MSSISEFNRFFSSKTLASTYKPTFVKCLLDLGDCKPDEGSQWIQKHGETTTVDLNFVAARFLRYYYPLKFKFKLKQEATSKTIAVYRILEEFKEMVGVKSVPSKKLLCSDDFTEMRQRTINEGIKPQVLKKLLNDCKIYSINKGSNSIVIQNEVIEYVRANKKVLEAALNHMIAQYMEKCNSSPNISTKLDERIPRITLNNNEFQKIISLQNSCCFYCGKKENLFAQEHFLPWNFLFQTENFNIVAACKTCNSSKNDRLPDRQYLEKIIQRNKKLIKSPLGYSEEYMKNLYENCKIEYHGIGKELWKV